jgi:class 3 adenylate cyclase
MSNRQRITQKAAIELTNSLSQLSDTALDSLNDSNASLNDSLEGSFELDLNDSGNHLDLAKTASENSNNNNNDSTNTLETPTNCRVRSRSVGPISGSRHSRRKDRERSRRVSPSQEASRSTHRRATDTDTTREKSRERKTSHNSSRNRRSIDKDSTDNNTSDGIDEKPSSARSSNSNNNNRDRGRSRKESDDQRPRSTSRSRRDRSKSRGPRSKSFNARAMHGRSRRNRGGGGNASGGSPRTSISPRSDKEGLGKSEPRLTLPSLSLDTGSKSIGGLALDNRSNVSETEILDFLTVPKPTRRLGDRGTGNSGERPDGEKRDRDRADRRERREQRERERKSDRSPRSPTRTSSADRISSSDAPLRNPRSESIKRRPPPKTKSSDRNSGLTGFLALPNRRSTSTSESRSVVSSPVGGVMSKVRRRTKDSSRKPSSDRSSGSASNDSSDKESSESYEEEEAMKPQSLKDFGERRRSPHKSTSAEGLGMGLGLTGDSQNVSKRSTPRRTKSSDAPKELGSFLAQPGRRRPPPGGTRSVASSPAGVVTGNTRKKKQLEEINNKHNRENSNADGKPSSSRSTITTEYASAGEFDSDYESVCDEENPGAMRHKTFRDTEKEREMQNHLDRTDDLLYSVFPKHVAEALKHGQKVEPENHECVTIFFSDIVGFTDISSSLDPMKISDMLDRLYNSFDTLSHYHDVFKVETIGDAYMAVTNLTNEQPDHSKRIAMFAADAIRVANQTLIDVDDPSSGHVNIRVGFHSGPVVSSVVGSRNPRYCLFGDTVNTASRMESNSEVNRIHCSDDSAKIIQANHPEIRLKSRGVINVKGKGKMNTYWVNEDESKGGSDNKFTKSVFNFMSKNRRGSM